MSEIKPERAKLTDPSRILTMANMVSLLRALLAIPIIYTLTNPDWLTYTFLLAIAGVLSDALDGYLARRAHEVTHFGKWLDPIADYTHFILHSNWWGKWGLGISALALILHIFPVKYVDWLPEVTLWSASILLAVSWVTYFKTFIQAFKTAS